MTLGIDPAHLVGQPLLALADQAFVKPDLFAPRGTASTPEAAWSPFDLSVGPHPFAESSGSWWNYEDGTGWHHFDTGGFIGQMDLTTGAGGALTQREHSNGFFTACPFDAYYYDVPPNAMGYLLQNVGVQLAGLFGFYLKASSPAAIDDVAFQASVGGMVLELVQVPHSAMTGTHPTAGNPDHWVSTLPPDDPSFAAYPVVYSFAAGVIPASGGWTYQTSDGQYYYQVTFDSASVPVLAPDEDGYVHLMARVRKTDGTQDVQMSAASVTASVAYNAADYTTFTWTMVANGGEMHQKTRWANGCPRFYKENWQFYGPSSPLTLMWTAYYQLQTSVDTAEVFMGWMGQDYAANSGASTRWWEPTYAVVSQRHDGVWFTYEHVDVGASGIDSSYYYRSQGDWQKLGDGTIRTGIPGVANINMPYTAFSLNASNPTYFRIGLTIGTTAGWRSQGMSVLQLAAYYNQPAKTAQRFWKWQPGDDHNGLQGHGYAYDVKPMGLGPKAKGKGMAFVGDDTIEGWRYDSRPIVYGYIEGEDPFLYGFGTEKSATWPDTNSLLGQSNFGNADLNCSDDKGEHFIGVYSEYGWFQPQIEGPYVGPSVPTQSVLHTLAKPNAEGELASPFALNGVQNDFDFVLFSPLYPDSIFVQHAQYAAPQWTQRLVELNKATGAVIREMTPISDPELLPGQRSGRSRLSAVMSDDGARILAAVGHIYNYDSSPAGYTHSRYLEYDLASQTVVVDEVSGATFIGVLSGKLGGGRILFIDPNGQVVYVVDLGAGTSSQLALQNYTGKGYSGGLTGFDGRYVYAYQLNYHIDRTAWIAGDGSTHSIGFGVSQFFAEFYRYDILGAHPLSADLMLAANGDGHLGANVDFTASGPGALAAPLAHESTAAASLVTTQTVADAVAAGHPSWSIHASRATVPAGTTTLTVEAVANSTNDGDISGAIMSASFTVLAYDGGGGLLGTFTGIDQGDPLVGDVRQSLSFTIFTLPTAAVSIDVTVNFAFHDRGFALDADHMHLNLISLSAFAQRVIPIEWLFNAEAVDQTGGLHVETDGTHYADEGPGEERYSLCSWAYPAWFVPGLVSARLVFDRFFGPNAKAQGYDMGFGRFGDRNAIGFSRHGRPSADEA